MELSKPINYTCKPSVCQQCLSLKLQDSQLYRRIHLVAIPMVRTCTTYLNQAHGSESVTVFGYKNIKSSLTWLQLFLPI